MNFTKETASMLANAVNNDRRRKIMTFPRATMANLPTSFRQRYQLTAVEDLEPLVILHSMEHYACTTDWSAFSRENWQSAYNEFRAVARI